MSIRSHPAGRPAAVRSTRLASPRQRTATRPVRRGLRRFLLVTADLAGLGLLVLLVFHSPWFTVESVEVNGVNRLTPAEVAQIGGISGQNLFLLDAQRAADRIRQATMARRVEVVRTVPNRVTVNVEERVPWAIWQTRAANYLIDEHGVVLGADPNPPPLPVLRDVERHLIDPGVRVDPSAVVLTQRLTDLLPARIGRRPVDFEYGPLGGLKVTLQDGLEVRFGTAEDLDYKLAALVVMLDDARSKGQRITFVDLRFGERSYYRAEAADTAPTGEGG